MVQVGPPHPPGHSHRALWLRGSRNISPQEGATLGSPGTLPAERILRKQDCPWGLSLPSNGTRSKGACKAQAGYRHPINAHNIREARGEVTAEGACLGSFWKPGVQPLWSSAHPTLPRTPKAGYRGPALLAGLCLLRGDVLGWPRARVCVSGVCVASPAAARTIRDLAVVLAPKAQSGGGPALNVSTGHIPVPGSGLWGGCKRPAQLAPCLFPKPGESRAPQLRLALNDHTAQPLFLCLPRPAHGDRTGKLMGPPSRTATPRGSGGPFRAREAATWHKLLFP